MRFNRRQTFAALGATLAMPYVRPSWAQSSTVNVYNWADYIGETTLEDFEAATGIGVVYDTYSSAEEMQAKMLAGSTGYDVVDHSGLNMPQVITAGVYQKLDKSKLPTWTNLDPAILKIMEGWDPGNEYGVPYMWGSVGFTFNLDLVKERLPDADLQSLDALFLPENAAKLAGVELDGVAPTFESIADGSYKASRELFIYIKKAHVGVIPGLQEFATEYVSRAALGEDGYLADKGLVTLPDDRLEKIVASVSAMEALKGDELK